MLPKKNQKNNQGEVAEDFDDMLADFRAADLANAPSSHVAQGVANDSPANAARAHVPEATIAAAIMAGDLTKLRRWHRQGIRYSADMVCNAAQLGSIAVMRCFVEELGADVNVADDDGCTPVSAASQNGHLGLVRYLVRMLGADVNKANAKGISPLIFAAENGDLKMVQCLLKDLGADVNQAMDDGTTPMIIAAGAGNLAMVQCIGAAHGSKINKANCLGGTALLFATQKGHLNVVQCLVEDFGADVNQKGNNDATPLMVASYAKHEKVVKWLLKHGADAQASTTSGTAADASRIGGAPIAQTEYLEAKAHCSKPGCSGAGLKKCTGCKQARYCGQQCQLAHWKAHKADCKATKKE
jgi:ankyrin repeat protein